MRHIQNILFINRNLLKTVGVTCHKLDRDSVGSLSSFSNKTWVSWTDNVLVGLDIFFRFQFQLIKGREWSKPNRHFAEVRFPTLGTCCMGDVFIAILIGPFSYLRCFLIAWSDLNSLVLRRSEEGLSVANKKKNDVYYFCTKRLAKLFVVVELFTIRQARVQKNFWRLTVTCTI